MAQQSGVSGLIDSVVSALSFSTTPTTEANNSNNNNNNNNSNNQQQLQQQQQQQQQGGGATHHHHHNNPSSSSSSLYTASSTTSVPWTQPTTNNNNQHDVLPDRTTSKGGLQTATTADHHHHHRPQTASSSSPGATNIARGGRHGVGGVVSSSSVGGGVFSSVGGTQHYTPAAGGGVVPSSTTSINKTYDATDEVPFISRQRSAPAPTLGSESPFADAAGAAQQQRHSLSQSAPPSSSCGGDGSSTGAASALANERYKDLTWESGSMLVILDMDHTLVGDLESLSDRDNVESNLPWEVWPENTPRGLVLADIVPYLQRGMLRPGVREFITRVRELGATVVIYTHSEEKWAKKVVSAIEASVGFKFTHRIFSRMDCKDGHPAFSARKSLRFVIREMPLWSAMTPATALQKTIFLDDDSTAVGGDELSRLITVSSYDYWEPCQWDVNLNKDLLAKNPPDLVGKLTTAVREWGIASPVFGKAILTAEDIRTEKRWAASRQSKQEMRLMFNKMLDKDSVFRRLTSVVDAEFSVQTPDVHSLPQKMRDVLGGKTQESYSARTTSAN